MQFHATKYLILSFILFYGLVLSAQTIINTENMLIDDEDKLSYAMSLQGDLNFGNLDLIQFSTAHQIAKPINKHLFRLLFNYDYIRESGTEISSDITSQLRYNYKINNNSFFAFLQAQNIKTLRLNHRYISGGGYRHRMIQKADNFWDLSVGLFFENELYDRNLITQNQVDNWRYSLSTFLKNEISEKLLINLSLYYQINTSTIKDYRLFLEPRMYYTLDKFNLFLDWTYRFHSTPYIDILRTDNSFNFGVEFNL